MIRIREVRLIDEKGEQVGVVPTEDALARAQTAGLDLVEVSPRSRPPVCKILDYGKFKYDLRKKEQQQNRKTGHGQMKEIRVRPKTGPHDLGVKLKKAREFLDDGNKVMFNVFFRGRERSHTELGEDILKRIVSQLEDVARIEHTPVMDGRRMTMMMLPKPKPKASGRPEAPPAAGAAAPARPTQPASPTTGGSHA